MSYYASYSERDNPKFRPASTQYTIHNEPYIEYENIADTICEYPDMGRAYARFAKIYELPLDRFILTNGTEDSLRITLSCIRRLLNGNTTELLYMTPNWGLIPIIAEQEGFQPVKYPSFVYQGYMISPDFVHNIMFKDGNVIYYNEFMNNYFLQSVPTQNIIEDNETDIFIVDEVYTNTYLTSVEKRKELSDNTIVIGSYSKSLGCGIRLGYIIYPESWNELFQHNRPNYISHLAAMHAGIRIPNNFDRKDINIREVLSNTDIFLPTSNKVISSNYITIEESKYKGDIKRIDKKLIWDTLDMDNTIGRGHIVDKSYVRLGIAK